MTWWWRIRLIRGVPTSQTIHISKNITLKARQTYTVLFFNVVYILCDRMALWLW